MVVAVRGPGAMPAAVMGASSRGLALARRCRECRVGVALGRCADRRRDAARSRRPRVRRWSQGFPVGHTTVGEKPDEHYWWEDHVPTRLYLAPGLGGRGVSVGTSGRIEQVNSQRGILV